MSLDPGYLIMSMIWGVIGLAYFVYGKKRSHPPTLIVGLSLMIFPYFVTEMGPMTAVGVVLTILPYIFRRYGI